MIIYRTWPEQSCHPSKHMLAVLLSTRPFVQFQETRILTNHIARYIIDVYSLWIKQGVFFYLRL
jgi:hypothetical protein